MKSSFRQIPIIACIIIATVQPLPAATDAELSQVAQLIQEGKNTEAKTALSKLLEREPNNHTLLSLQRQISNTPNNNQNTTASIEETIQFIQSKLKDHQATGSATGRGGTTIGTYTIQDITYKEGVLRLDWKKRVNLGSDGSITYTVSESATLTYLSPELELYLTPATTYPGITATPILKLKISASSPDTVTIKTKTEDRSFGLNETTTSASKANKLEIEFNEDQRPLAERIAKAFSHLITLSGGKKEAF
jgi:hypothetical protein